MHDLTDEFNAMATPRQVWEAEERRQRAHGRREAYAAVANMTLRTAFRDAGEALVGIPADLFGPKPAPLTVLTKNNRLRGLGVMLALVGLAGLVLEFIL